MNKAVITDIVAFLISLTGFLLPNPWGDPIKLAGLFALSGAITNHLAVHMLFHKVPLLYGSGVIEKNFDRFKSAIKEMIMSEFFSKDQIEALMQNKEQKIDITPLINSINFDPAFDALKQSILESKFAPALGIFGGENALEGLREPFKKKLSDALTKIVTSETFRSQLQSHIKSENIKSGIQSTIETLIAQRLQKLTPSMVKTIIERLIAEHLGWLVVWGGVFGAVIGLLSSLLIV